MNSKPRSENNLDRSVKCDKQALLICALLFLAVVLVFCQTGRHEFVNFDDDRYVYDNDQIKQGLTLNGLGYFIVHRHSYTYHPVTSYSHMLDCQLFGMDAGKHHWTNVLLHAGAAAGLFLVLRLMTGRLWPSALVAAVFAVHPLRVESVAWISERRDVLSGLLLMLTLWAYVRYVRRPHELRQYMMVCLLFALGLLAKPMLVTLPLVLLLLDYWPLGRWHMNIEEHETSEYGDRLPAALSYSGTLAVEGNEDDEIAVEVVDDGIPLVTKSGGAPSRCLEPGDAPAVLVIAPDPSVDQSRTVRRQFPWGLLTEKIPLVLLALADCVVTLYTQGDGGAIQPLDAVSWKARIANVPIAYANYIGSFFWPQGLAVLYPHPYGKVDCHDAAIKAGFLAVATVAALLLWRRMPYLLVGWLWYLVTLLPVIGLLQVGGQAMADRYTYLPQIGLAMAVVWAVAAVGTVGFSPPHAEGGLKPTLRPSCRAVLAIASIGILAALAGAAWRQTAYWRNSESLWSRELSFPQYNNVVAHYDFGLALAENGHHREAVEQYEAALARDPSDESSRLNLGISYEALGSADAALRQYRKVVEDNPKSTSGQENLARLIKAQEEKNKAPNPKHIHDAKHRIERGNHE